MPGSLARFAGRTAKILVAILGAAALATATVATPAQADTLVYQYGNWQTGLCLDSNYNGQVYALGCNGGNYQQWRGKGVYAVYDVQTGLCLDSNYDGQVYTMGCNGGNYQNWGFYTDIHGRGFSIKNLQTGLCLDSNYAGQVYTLGCNDGNYQQWYLR